MFTSTLIAMDGVYAERPMEPCCSIRCPHPATRTLRAWRAALCAEVTRYLGHSRGRQGPSSYPRPLAHASVQGLVATGPPRRGCRRSMRLGGTGGGCRGRIIASDARGSPVSMCNANVRVRANDRVGLEHLCRYLPDHPSRTTVCKNCLTVDCPSLQAGLARRLRFTLHLLVAC